MIGLGWGTSLVFQCLPCAAWTWKMMAQASVYLLPVHKSSNRAVSMKCGVYAPHCHNSKMSVFDTNANVKTFRSWE